MRRLGVEKALPKPDPERGVFLDFGDFTERNEHLFLENPARTPHERTKRENKDDPKESVKLTMAEVDAIRTKCSKFYKYLKHLKMEETAGKESSVKISFDEEENCPVADYKEDVSYNPLCQLEVFCDKFGCYDYNLDKYRETRDVEPNGDVYRCPICAEVCWEASFFKSWSNGTLSFELVLSILNSSRTPDLSDVLGLYQPSDEDLESYSTPAKDFIQTCSFDRQPCSHKQFHSWVSDQYGVCHTFNSAFRKVALKNGKTVSAVPRKTSSVGPKSGIRLTLSIRARNYLTLLSPDLGAKVIVHSPRRIPFPEDEGFNVSPGVSVSVSVGTKRIERVGPPWGDCEDETESEVFKEYSDIRCKKLCQENEIWDSCGCYLGRSPAYESSFSRPGSKCSPFNITEKLCMETVRFSYQNGLLNCDCPPACNDTVYNTKVTTSEDNTKFYTIVQNIKQANMGDDLCLGTQNETVRLHVYLESLTYEVIHESPAYTWDTLVCNVGGNLGLFIGMSLVTIVEVFEFLLDLGLLCFTSRRKTKPESQLVEVKPTGRVAAPVAQGVPVAAEVADGSTQTKVTLHPFRKDSTWKLRAMGRKPRVKMAFNRVFLSQ
ncbi:degenerin-like protein asic-1 isoform X2 [Penaeus vannamei]|uniref:degenerin-like protein asic-1 isoform X2 n=1 Tax=Penaeus vannamei TaxID=6689 RepID=UPI00387F402D